MGKKAQPKQSNGQPLYWACPVHLKGHGTVTGLCDPQQLEEFKAATADVEGFDLDAWVTTEAPQEKRRTMIQ